MLSDADATIAAGIVGGVFGLGGVWLGFYLSRRVTEKDRRAEKLLRMYRELERLGNLLVALQKEMLSKSQFYSQWLATTESIIAELIGSGVDRKRVLKAINVKWNDPNGVKEVRELAREFLKQIDPEYEKAASEHLDELGLKPEDIDPIIVRR